MGLGFYGLPGGGGGGGFGRNEGIYSLIQPTPNP